MYILIIDNKKNISKLTSIVIKFVTFLWKQNNAYGNVKIKWHSLFIILLLFINKYIVKFL